MEEIESIDLFFAIDRTWSDFFFFPEDTKGVIRNLYRK